MTNQNTNVFQDLRDSLRKLAAEKRHTSEERERQYYIGLIAEIADSLADHDLTAEELDEQASIMDNIDSSRSRSFMRRWFDTDTHYSMCGSAAQRALLRYSPAWSAFKARNAEVCSHVLELAGSEPTHGYPSLTTVPDFVVVLSSDSSRSQVYKDLFTADEWQNISQYAAACDKLRTQHEEEQRKKHAAEQEQVERAYQEAIDLMALSIGGGEFTREDLTHINTERMVRDEIQDLSCYSRVPLRLSDSCSEVQKLPAQAFKQARAIRNRVETVFKSLAERASVSGVGGVTIRCFEVHSIECERVHTMDLLVDVCGKSMSLTEIRLDG